MWEALGRHLPTGYQRLPAAAGLHLTVRANADQTGPEPLAAIRERGLLVSALSRTYAFTEPTPGFLLGFAGLPTPLVVPAVRALGAALAEAS